MIARVLLALCLLPCLAGGVVQAAAATPGCTVTTSKLRYQPAIVYTCDAPIGSATSSFAVTRVSNGASVPVTVTVSGAVATVEVQTTLASGAGYRATATIDDGGSLLGPTATTWTTMPPPAHPKLSIEYITAIPDHAAVRDMLQRIDAANLFVPPTAARTIDASSGTMTTGAIESALTGRQAALVVGGDADFAFPGNLGGALAWFAGKGHGVVTAGQTHWVKTADWSFGSAVGQGTAWDHSWDVYGNDAQITPDRISGGAIAGSTIVKHFVTTGLKSFKVIGPSSGEMFPHFITGSTVLASFPRSGSGLFATYPQSFLTIRQVGPSRLIDLGYRPWSSGLPGGGFDPAVSPGGALLARSLWWSMNRIPPTGTHFTTKPPARSGWATVSFGFGATDPDLDHAGALRYRYRIDGGAWKWAVGNAAVFFNLAKGRYHTVSVYAQDSGGNRDPRATSYRFLVNSNARS